MSTADLSLYNGNGTYDTRHQVQARPFAGRIGGNLTFCQAHDEVVKRTPDAAPLSNWTQVVDIYGFLEPIYIKAACIECAGTFVTAFMSGITDNAFGSFQSTSSQLAINVGHAALLWVMISVLIFSFGPASGGHLNPFITILTFFAGLCTLPRMVYYIIGQLVGALAGSWFVKLGMGGSQHYFPTGIIPACTINFNLVSVGQAFALEFGVYLCLAFLAFGVGLDPRQGQVYGPSLSPILVGAVVAFTSFGTGNVRPGWYGGSSNPARCFGAMAAKSQLHGNWIHWVAAITAAMFHGAVYGVIPPNTGRK